MTDTHTIDPLTVEMTTRNIRLTGRFLEEILDNPDILDEFPDDATVVLMPPDDPDLALYNANLALTLGGTNEDIIVRRVGIEPLAVPAWETNEIRSMRYRELQPHWPETIAPTPGDLQIVYDRERDVLRIDFFGGRRLGMGVPFRAGTVLLIDPDADDEIVGYLIGGFLEVAAQRAPQLITTLRLADLRPLTDDELGGLAPPPAPEAGGNRTEREKADSLASEFGKLTA